MTIYHLSDDLGAINFNPLVDVLVVDDTSMHGIDFEVGSIGAVQGLWIHENNHEVFLKNISLGNLTTHNFINDYDGSKFIFGDNTPGLAGDNGPNTLNGTAFADKLFGAGGNDVISGGDGNDSLRGGAGNDRIGGGHGGDSIKGGSGADRIFGGTGGDSLNGDSGADLIHGGLGSDDINGGGGRDQLFGEAGRDSLFGAGGKDFIDGGDDNDSLNGGAGDDVLRGSGGNDSIRGGYGNDALSGGVGDDSINGGIGNDVASGGDGSDSIHGDSLTGSLAGGNDILRGNANDDSIWGDGGDDQLFGGDGADSLFGGTGFDDLTGGNNNDNFLFNKDDATFTSSQIDEITDFVTGADLISESAGAADDTTNYSETDTSDTTIAGALTSATSHAASTLTITETYVFVAGDTNGWLFISTDGDDTNFEEAIQLDGLSDLGDLDDGDILSTI